MHKSIIQLLVVIRGSFPDATIVYSFGGCYGLYQILKEIYPRAVAYFDDSSEDHILTRIEGKYYDIGGEFPFIRSKKSELIRLTGKHHEHWQGVAAGQRIELILAKYARYSERLRKDV